MSPFVSTAVLPTSSFSYEDKCDCTHTCTHYLYSYLIYTLVSSHCNTLFPHYCRIRFIPTPFPAIVPLLLVLVLCIPAYPHSLYITLCPNTPFPRCRIRFISIPCPVLCCFISRLTFISTPFLRCCVCRINTAFPTVVRL